MTTSVCLDVPGFGPEAAKALARMLQTNQSLMHLNILNTGFSKEDFHWIADAVDLNHHILALDIEYSRLNLQDSRKIADAIQRNRGLRKRRVRRRNSEPFV